MSRSTPPSPRFLWHVTLRGAGRVHPFPKERDRFAFLARLRGLLEGARAGCEGFCVMPQEARLVLAAPAAESLRGFLEPACRAYSRYWHEWYPPRLRVFGAVNAVGVPEPLRWDVLAALEHEPVRAGLCRDAWLYRWSSAAAHSALGPSYLPLALEAWREAWTHPRWRERLGSVACDVRALKEAAKLLGRARPLRALAAQDLEAAPPPLLQAGTEAARAAGAAF